ncbi:3-methyl-2-oxobutanoate hydroxymethyltransferase [Gossypium australe]|uniref:3-methyl-2-oxobutanoate hydroxymethyltransferase n=1 Tax=Gossypium australe TaxID=47621 RepID=A0A5B6UHQ6_9ROSI|nr:3-methyl-2-oxobutanoate hydroxymethyltransferase [Gossypium australe]
MQVQSLIRRNEESTGRANSLKLPSACSWLVEYMADFNGETSNKDKRYRKRAKECHELQADLICMILDGDDKYRTTRRWEDKQVIVVEAMNRLRDPHLLQQWLRKLQSGIVENPIQALQKEMEVQGEAIEDQTEQLISEAKDFRMVAEVLNKVWTSYVAKQQLTDPVSIQDLVQTDDESFIFHFPLTPDCSRCAKIRINLQDLSSLGFFDVEKHDLENHLPDFAHQYPGEGSSDARANQENMKLSYENISTVQGHADFQNILTNSLAEADHKIESNPEMLGLRDITNMDVTVQNKNNLEKPRVRKKLEEETKKNKANITKGKRKVEKGEADLKENILKVKKDVAGLKENRMKQRKGNAKLQENQLKLTSLPKKPRGA